MVSKSDLERHEPDHVFYFLFVLVIAARLAMVFFVPFGQNVRYHLEGLNDEPAHYNYVKHLALYRSFPVLEHWVNEKDAFARNEFEYHQPPLYYLLCVPLYLIFGEQAGIWPCRLLSFFFGIASLWVVSSIVGELGCKARMRQTAVLFTGILFPHLYFTTLVSNDALSWLLSLLLTREMVRLGGAGMDTPKKTPSLAAIVFYLCAGLLTKSSMLLFFPVLAGVFIYKYIISKRGYWLLSGALAIGTAGIGAVPWYLRNMTLYHSLTGMPAATAPASLAIPTLLGFTKGVIKLFWFPMQHLAGGTPPFFWLCAIGAVLLAAHAAFAVFEMVRRPGMGFGPVLLLVLFAVNIAAAFWYYVQWQNPEARFLFPALASIVFFMIVPAHRVFKKLTIERFFLPYTVASSLFPYMFLVWAK